MSTIRENRQHYSNTVEPAPSRFTNEGEDYRAWAARADDYAAAAAHAKAAHDQTRTA